MMKKYFIITKNADDEVISKIEKVGDDADLKRDRREARKYNDLSNLHGHGEYRYVTTKNGGNADA